MCMRQTPQLGCAATSSSAPGARNALMSLTMSTPIASAARITSGLALSSETGQPSFSAPSSTGSTRRSSSSTLTACAPGRLDSPPMSSMSAPSLSSCSQCASAECTSKCWPPSENESGVTLTMPITLGSVKSIAKRVVCQIIKESGAKAPRCSALHRRPAT